jgi:transposase InsO family protein
MQNQGDCDVFGPKRAPSYFQEMMASIVLLGLIYNICEMYLDDCIVHAKGNDEFIIRLETIFKRFSDKNIKLKASKCKFGLKQIEYVGRQISKEGISMSTTRIRAVQDFPKPVVLTQLRSFLGLANYFRDFVPNHSNVVSPLHQMIDHAAKKQSKLIWTAAGETAYAEIKDLISKSPLLYFMSDTAPIVLMTDASDYGVGGYLYQLVDGKEQLIALVSKSLTPTQLKWSVIQKEAYAIAFCCKSLEALLRDRKFTILTDHRNLTFMKEESNPMVQRWYTALQELDYDLKYVPGIHNTIADAMSRLCPNYKVMEDTTPTVLAALHSQPVIDDENNITIERCHNPVVGHGGVERTLRKIKDLKLSWPTMRADVKQYIRECPCCQKMSQIKTPINVLKFTTSTYRPMEALNMDFIGPFPDKGYVLVIIDTFSRWVELYATKDATAKAACTCLIEHFGRFGCPSYIRSDNGPQFVNDLIRLFLEATGTPHNRTLAYSSEENAIVERSNKEVNRHIRAFIFQRGTIENYQQVLPFVQRILNSEINSKLNASPATIMFGNAVNLDRGILLPDDEQPPTQSLSKATSKMLHMQFLAIKAAKKSLEQADSEHKASTPTELTEFASNSYVIAMQRSAPETRLHTLWRGPFRVLSNTGSQYSLLDLITGKEKLYHVTQLKAFHFNPLKTDPVDVARKDYLEFFIESIIQLDGSFDKLATLRFKIKWLGYDETHNTWEPWKNLRKTTALHQFLIAKQLRHRIPKEFQSLYPE